MRLNLPPTRPYPNLNVGISLLHLNPNSTQVMAFCQQCAKEDECELVYDKAEEYIDHLAAAAKEDK